MLIKKIGNRYKPIFIEFYERKDEGTIVSEIKIRNFISIDGQPKVLFDSLPKENKKKLLKSFRIMRWRQ